MLATTKENAVRIAVVMEMAKSVLEGRCRPMSWAMMPGIR